MFVAGRTLTLSQGFGNRFCMLGTYIRRGDPPIVIPTQMIRPKRTTFRGIPGTLRLPQLRQTPWWFWSVLSTLVVEKKETKKKSARWFCRICMFSAGWQSGNYDANWRWISFRNCRYLIIKSCALQLDGEKWHSGKWQPSCSHLICWLSAGDHEDNLRWCVVIVPILHVPVHEN